MSIYERKNTQLIKEFNRYVREHPEFADDIPKNAVVVMQLEGSANSTNGAVNEESYLH